jgi:glycerol-3-phosphate dehydrogenase
MAMFRSYKLHQTHRGLRAAELEPTLRTEGLDGAVSYYDFLTDDARLTLETARSAHEAGAHVITYAEVTGFTTRRGQVTGVDVADVFTGETRAVSGRVVLNATGPWTDRTRGLRGDRPRMLRPTKGVHLVVAHARLPISNAVVMSILDGQTLFAIPWGNRVVLGTTDTDFSGDFDDVAATAEDVASLLELGNYGFPAAGLGPEDVIGTWAGLRPLVAQEGLSERDISREHLLRVDEDGLITIAGGKLTTYRSMAAEVVDAIARRLRSEGFHVGGCPTAGVRLSGGEGIERVGERLHTPGPEGASIDREAEARLGVDVVDHLKEAHGGNWLRVAARTVEDPDSAARIVADLPYLWAEVDIAVDEELATTVIDVLRRRTQIQLKDFEQGQGVADAVARRMGARLGWDELRIHDELAAYTRVVDASLRWRSGQQST